MALIRTAIDINFSGGNWRSASSDANGFWLTLGTYTSTTDIALNQTTIDISGLTLNHNSSGMFIDWTLTVYLRAEYTLNGVSQTKYFYGDSNGNSIGQKTISGTTLSLLSDAQISPVVIPHNSDGSRPDVVIRGYCDAVTDASFVPVNTTANTSAFSFDRTPLAKRFNGSTNAMNYIGVYRRYNSATSAWNDVTVRRVFNGATSSWVDLGSR